MGLELSLVIIVIKDQFANCKLKYLERGKRIFCKSCCFQSGNSRNNYFPFAAITDKLG